MMTLTKITIRPDRFFMIRVVVLLGSILWAMMTNQANAQQEQMQFTQPQIRTLTLNEAIALTRAQNIAVKIAETELSAVDEDLKDSKRSVLPVLTTGGTYQRYTKALLFEDGLGGVRSVGRRPGPNGASLNLESSFNVFSGGKVNATIAEAKIRKDMAENNSADQTGNSVLQTAAQYLDLVRKHDLGNIIKDQLTRAETRLKIIHSLYKNQRVTRSDVLRAEVGLSNAQLNKIQNDNDILILNRKLGVLLNLGEELIILPADSANAERPAFELVDGVVKTALDHAYNIKRAEQNIRIQETKLKGVRSNYSPSVSLFSAYGFNYPNNIFYPPIDQLYSIGFIGVKVSYNISSLYHVRHKESAARIRVNNLEQQKELVKLNTRQEVDAQYIKYKEALNRVEVMKKSIEQSKINYRIMTTKYQNQLALLTDLLDADNLLQEALFSLSNAQTSASVLYYQLLYTTGNL